MPGKLEGKVAFITGAARGQGRSHAIMLAKEGADIIALDIAQQDDRVPYDLATPDEMADTARAVEKVGRKIVWDLCDIRDLEGQKELVSQGVNAFGRLDIVAANAAVGIPGPWFETTPDIMRITWEINVMGTWNSVMASVEHLIENGSGSIILTSSANGIKAGPYNLAYNVSKFGVNGMAKSFAQELAKHNIRVNSIHPGGVDTPMAHSGLPKLMEMQNENPELWGMLSQWIPGLMPPEEITKALIFLASDDSTWITGHSLAVDGGMSLY